MGCDCSKSRPVSLEEEFSIRDFEAILGFSHISARKFFKALKEITPAPRLSRSQFLLLLSKTGLLQCDVGNQAHPLTKFYAWLKVEQFWDSTKLIALSLVLSPGTFDKKLSVVFTTYDPDYTHHLSASALESFLRDVCVISLKLLPTMAEGMLLEQGLVTQSNRVSLYRKKLEANIEETVLYLKAELLGTEGKEVSEETLREKELALKQAFVSKDLREMTINFWKFRKTNAFQHSLTQKQINVDSMLT